MHLILQREPGRVDRRTFPARITVFGEISIDGVPECRTLEDAVHNDPLETIENQKVPGLTAILAGTYELVLQDSPKFGPNCPTLRDVAGFDHVRMHSGTDIDSTEGCIIVGDVVNYGEFTIGGGKVRGVYMRLQAKIIMARARGERVTIEIRDVEEA